MAERDESKSNLPTIAILLVGFLIVGGMVGVEVWPHFFGARPSDIADVSLAQTPKQLARALPASHAGSSDVTVKFRSGVSGIYKDVRFSWEGSPDHVTGMALTAEADEKDKDKKSQERSEKRIDDLLAPYLHGGVRSRSWQWGGVSFSTRDDGGVSFRVDPTLDKHQPNPLFERQVEAARDVMLAAALQTPVSVSHQELADVLGAGYPLADVARIDPSTLNDAALPVLKSKFPGLDSKSARLGWSVTIAIDHPLVRDVQLRRAAATSNITFDLTADMNDKTRRVAFVACLGEKLQTTDVTKLGTFPRLRTAAVDVTIYDSTLELTSRRGNLDASVTPPFFAALEACR
jgi:hypothetical protein